MDEVSQIRQKIDIVSLISEYLPLKKLGRNFKTVCPFHAEKTPSFVVSPERQIWHCFGCSKGGDVFTFLMEFERMEFPEALRMLAKRTGVTLPRRNLVLEGATKKKEQMYRANHLAQEFYHYVLTKHDRGTPALAYLHARGITDSAIIRFKLGFAPNISQGLLLYLTEKKNFPGPDLQEAGLIFRSENTGQNFIDRFRNRIMFPLSDHRGNIVGFSGRVLGESKDVKYVNTPETLVYHKGDLLFGLDLARENIRKKGTAILVEGEIDVIQGAIHNIDNMVAIKGTALTENQISLLSRFADKVSICLDFDNAGVDAMWRSIALLEEKGVLANVIRLPLGKDPDESLRKNPSAFLQAVKKEVPIYDFLIDSALTRFDPATPEGKKKISDQVLPFLMKIQNEIVKDHYVKKMSTSLSVSEESIMKEMEKLKKENAVGFRNRTESVVRPTKKTMQELLEEYLIALLLQSENLSFSLGKIQDIITPEYVATDVYRRILILLIEFAKKENQTFSIQAFIEFASPELHPMIDTCYLLTLPTFSREAGSRSAGDGESRFTLEIEKKAAEVKAMTLKVKMHDITLKMKKEEEARHEEQLTILKKEFNEVVEILRSLTLSTLTKSQERAS